MKKSLQGSASATRLVRTFGKSGSTRFSMPMARFCTTSLSHLELISYDLATALNLAGKLATDYDVAPKKDWEP